MSNCCNGQAFSPGRTQVNVDSKNSPKSWIVFSSTFDYKIWLNQNCYYGMFSCSILWCRDSLPFVRFTPSHAFRPVGKLARIQSSSLEPLSVFVPSILFNSQTLFSTVSFTYNSNPKTYDFIEMGPQAKILKPISINIIPNAITPREEEVLEREITKKLRRLFGREGYREAHTDHVITGYKEAIVSAWTSVETASSPGEKEAVEILDKTKLAMSKWLGPNRPAKWTPPHVLDMRDGNSGIRAHVDFVESSGDVIGGLCLISPAVIIFRNVKNPDRDYFKLFVPARCLYMQADDTRYNYTHEIPMTDDPAHSFKGEFVERHRRVCAMFRTKKDIKQ
ncbi:hypothetical protein BDV3_005581 [Batrachochytrium dendrobatidis]